MAGEGFSFSREWKVEAVLEELRRHLHAEAIFTIPQGRHGNTIRFTRYEMVGPLPPLPCGCVGCVRFREMAPRLRTQLEESDAMLARAFDAAFPGPEDDGA